MRAKKGLDIFFTALYWLLFLSGMFVVFIAFPLLYIISLFMKRSRFFFQDIMHYLLKLFFWVLKNLIPGLDINVKSLKEIKNIRSSIILCNHISYLDGLFIMSIIKRQIAIVKSSFFRVPVLGWIIHLAGFIPADRSQLNVDSLLSLEKIQDFIDLGGNLLIFPEGKRSHTGKINQFQKGAFTLTYKVKANLEILYIKNTNRLFGLNNSLLFNTCVDNTIELSKIAQFRPDSKSKNPLLAKKLKEDVYSIYQLESEKDSNSE